MIEELRMGLWVENTAETNAEETVDIDNKIRRRKMSDETKEKIDKFFGRDRRVDGGVVRTEKGSFMVCRDCIKTLRQMGYAVEIKRKIYRLNDESLGCCFCSE